MFGLIIDFFRDVRIKLAFNSYEVACHLEHEAQAEKQFADHEFQNEINTIKRKIENEADKIFKNNIENLRHEIAIISSDIISKEKLLSFFLRNYKKELSDAYVNKKTLLAEKPIRIAELQKLKLDLSMAYEGKNEAYEEVESCQDDIDSWYDKSERSNWLFGNKGREIPKHSFFGQSHGDLSCSYNERTDAYANVEQWREKIGKKKENIIAIKNRLDAISLKLANLSKSISQIKADRDCMFKLREEGHRDHKLKTQIREWRSTLEQENIKLNKQESLRSEFVKAKINQYGVIVLENKIQDILARKVRYLASFDLEENRTKRINDHRAAWLNERNLT